MDKSWISKDKDSLDVEIGVEKFLNFAEENSKDPKRILVHVVDALILKSSQPK